MDQQQAELNDADFAALNLDRRVTPWGPTEPAKVDDPGTVKQTLKLGRRIVAGRIQPASSKSGTLSAT